MSKEISSSETRNNLKRKDSDEKYWGIKIGAVLILLLVSFIIYKIIYWNSVSPKTQPVKQIIEQPIKIDSTVVTIQTIKFNVVGLSVDEVYKSFKREILNRIDTSKLYSSVSLKANFSNGQFLFKFLAESSNIGFKSFALIFNPTNTPPFSKDKVLQKNSGSEVLEHGMIDNYDYYLIGLK